MISSNIEKYFALHMSVANNSSILEFLDLSLQINEDNKICVDVYAKPTSSFT